MVVSHDKVVELRFGVCDRVNRSEVLSELRLE
jgi:hypothetical protein